MFLKTFNFRPQRTHFTIFLKVLIYGCILYLFLAPWRFASHYAYTDKNFIYNSFVKQITRNISLQKLQDCSYLNIVKENEYMYIDKNSEKINNINEIMKGGEYYPQNCRAQFSSSIIIPYREREEQLNKYLIYMHNYLRKQKLHYRIFIVEQYDNKPFNRAKLFNVGSNIAASYGFPCLILHDVDLIPTNLGQLYACSKKPRHMCSSLDVFRYHLPYRGLFGGVVSIQTKQFRALNGLSNMFNGWGGEDDDFFERLKARNIAICRFDPKYSKYIMFKHKKEKPNINRISLLINGSARFRTDGLNSLSYLSLTINETDLFTHIKVKT